MLGSPTIQWQISQFIDDDEFQPFQTGFQSQDRALLTRLSTETGGKYYPIDDANSLPDDIVYTQGGITERSVHELWSLPIVFFFLMALKGTEWGLRKVWGSV